MSTKEKRELRKKGRSSNNLKKTKSKAVINPREFAKDILLIIIGTFIFATGVYVFTSPNQIAPGGVSGISTIIYHLTGLPLGAVNITLNIPIMVVGLIYLGKRFMVKTIISLVTFTLVTDYVLANMPTYTGDKLVAAIFGGIMMGVGIGTVFTRVGSTGGMDIINKIINRKLPHIKIGQLTFCSDVVVMAISAIAFKSIEPALYAAIALFISSKAIDTVLYGFNICKLMYVITDHAEEISQDIIKKMHRGATILEGHGAYTNQKRPTIMCAVRQNEYFKVKKIIYAIDPNAFVIIAAANEIVGAGFQPYDESV